MLLVVMYYGRLNRVGVLFCNFHSLIQKEQCEHSAKHLLLSFTVKGNSYGFGTT